MCQKVLLLTALLFCVSCSDRTPFTREGTGIRLREPGERPAGADVVTFFGLGDWGTGGQAQKAVASVLESEVARIPADKKLPPFVLGLGDNVYEKGLPRGWEKRSEAVARLEATFGKVYRPVRYAGQTINFHVVPGNHDYDSMLARFRDYGDVLHQETTAEALYSFWKYYPIAPEENPGGNDSTEYATLARESVATRALPEQIDIAANETIAIFAIDTEVLLELYDKEDDRVRLHWQRLATLVSASHARWKMIIGHHPIRTHGKHGGFTRAFWWIPPLTIVPIVDKLLVKTLNDLDHPAYRRFQTDMAAFMDRNAVQVYLSGHDHSLQMLGIDDRHLQVVSGSAGKLSGTGHADDSYFSHSAYGFVRFDVVGDEMWVTFLAVDPQTATATGTTIFSVREN